MRAVIQRVSEATCRVDEEITGEIAQGLVVLLGMEADDTEEELQWLTQKIINLRVFSDEDGRMNRSVQDVGGEILLISQFTLMAQTKKGNRPSFIRAAKPDVAEPLYEQAIKTFSFLLSKSVATGVFGADMKIQLVNDGPVTIIMNTRDRDEH